MDRRDARAYRSQRKNDEETYSAVARTRLLIGGNGDVEWCVALHTGGQESRMKMNESPRERIIRGSVGAVLLIFASFLQGPYDIFQGIFGIALLVFGGMSLVSGVVGWCPIYALLGISTYSPEK